MAAPLFVADEVVTAEKMNSLPKGFLGYAEVTTSQTGITTAGAVLTGVSVSVTLVAGRRIKLTAQTSIVQRTSAGNPTGFFRQTGVSVGRYGRLTMATNDQFLMAGTCVLTPAAGTWNYTLFLQTSANTVDTNPSATEPVFLLVEDIGSV